MSLLFVVSWKPCSTCCARDASGAPCRMTSRPGAPYSTITPGGADVAPGSRSTRRCVSSIASPSAEGHSPQQPLSTASPSAPPRPAVHAATTVARRSPAASAISWWTQGSLLKTRVHPADIHDRSGAPLLLAGHSSRATATLAGQRHVGWPVWPDYARPCVRPNRRAGFAPPLVAACAGRIGPSLRGAGPTCPDAPPPTSR